jgi:hypothetical protein
MTGIEINLNRTDAEAVLARDVRQGDVVLGCTVLSTWTGKIEVIEHSDPYVADPQPDTPGCQCPGHTSLEEDDRAKELVILYDGEIWDYACDVVPADDYVIIRKRPQAEVVAEVVAEQAPQDEQAAPEMRPLSKGSKSHVFEHKGTTVYVYPTSGNRELWSARPEGHKTIVSHRKTREEAARAAVAYLDGDDSQRTGFDMLSELLSL